MQNELSKIGLGCWGMSHAYGHADRKEAIATIKEALSIGINLIDTADIYGAGENEKLVGEAIFEDRQNAFLSSKFGFVGNEHEGLTINGRPDYVKKACESSLKRLKTDYIDLYFLHRKDPDVPIEETIGAMGQLVSEGKIRFIGLSEVGPDTIKRANKELRVSAIQSEYSLFSRNVEMDIFGSM